MTVTSEQLGLAVRNARIDLNWTQADLALRAGVSREWVGKMERGARRLEFDKVLAMLELLGFNILGPGDAAISDAGAGHSRRRVSSGARMLAEIEKGQQLAGHSPSAESLDRARRVLHGELSASDARAELAAQYRR